MSADASETTVRDFFETVWNEGDVARAAEFLAADFVSHNGFQLELLGPEGYARGVAMMRHALPDLHTTLELVISTGDYVCVRGRDRGTHLGELFDHPPSGRAVSATWIEIFRIRDGKIAEGWLEMDTAGFLRQLTQDVTSE
jgi:steroid delta-isomerase-like uncharacterized protein